MVWKRKPDCEYKLSKPAPGKKVWCVQEMYEGEQTVWPMLLVSFDGKKIYNLYGDYSDNMTPEEVEILDMEKPGLVEFFKKR
ncbi:MAG: hypothetical protein LUD41_02675 [Phascolarctobacterium sp.]|nr:hypothetical protein [Phascolarctobacterium sp.]